jgi:hypothetical protein
MRTLPRNAKGEYDLEHVQRVTNVHDLRRGHVNVSLVALVDASARNNDAQWPLALRVRDSHSSATVYLSPKFARAAAVLLGGEMIYLQNVCARATVAAGSHKSTRFVLDELTLNTELTVVSQLSNVLVTPSVCKPRSLAWLLERARAGRRRRRPVEHAAIHARITALHGFGRGATCGTAAHSLCERALVFSAEHRSLCCSLCTRPVQQHEITTIYTLQCELTCDDDGAESTTMLCTLRNSAAYHLLGMTATQYELLDDIARAQIQSRVLMKSYAMFVALVRQRRTENDDDQDQDDDDQDDDDNVTFRIDGVTANRADQQQQQPLQE